MSSSTIITSLAFANNKLYVGGTTSDNDLRNYTTISAATPIILKYYLSGDNYMLEWGRTFMADGGYIVNGIAVSTDELFVTGHAYAPTQDSIIFLIRIGGYNNFIYQYGNSKNNASLNRKNILLGLITITGTYRFIFGSRFIDNAGLY